ncbi:hypothetical protein, partial [Lyngbya confervoides]
SGSNCPFPPAHFTKGRGDTGSKDSCLKFLAMAENTTQKEKTATLRKSWSPRESTSGTLPETNPQNGCASQPTPTNRRSSRSRR